MVKRMERFSPPKLLPSMDITRFQESREEREWKEPFTFVLGADTQIGLIALKLGEPEPDWSQELAHIREAIQKINKMSPLPRFFCICGDILDAYPFLTDKPSGDIFRREKQYRDFVEAFQELDPEVKLICVCRNHDMGDIPTRDAVAVYRRQFGQDYFYFWVGGVKFVVLNSQYMFAPEAVPEETKRQEEFMETIADPSAKHIMVFQHIPYFALDPNEDKCANLIIPRPQRHTYLENLQNSGVHCVFCGHHHINMENSYKDIKQVNKLSQVPLVPLCAVTPAVSELLLWRKLKLLTTTYPSAMSTCAILIISEKEPFAFVKVIYLKTRK